MHKKWLLLTLLLLLGLPASQVNAAGSGQVSVTLPTFEVTLNGQTTASTYSRYPLLVYHDITYFPMTYHDSRLLGVQSDWTAQDGLRITKADGYFYEYSRQINERPNTRRLTATLATGPIMVNGQAIDNAAEDYPLLVFRDVTYFPLTWRFAVEEFGWDYTFDQTQGLTITNDAVIMEDPEPWQSEVRYSYAGGASSLAGAEDLRFPIRGVQRKHTFALSDFTGTPSGETTNPHQFSLSLFNYTESEDVTILPMEQWEYRLTRELNGQQELIYWRKIPFYSGYMAARNVTYGKYYTNPFWYSDELKPGTYHIEIIHPAEMLYTIGDSDTIQRYTIEEAPEEFGTDGAFTKYFFSETIIVIK